MSLTLLLTSAKTAVNVANYPQFKLAWMHTSAARFRSWQLENEFKWSCPARSFASLEFLNFKNPSVAVVSWAMTPLTGRRETQCGPENTSTCKEYHPPFRSPSLHPFPFSSLQLSVKRCFLFYEMCCASFGPAVQLCNSWYSCPWTAVRQPLDDATTNRCFKKKTSTKLPTKYCYTAVWNVTNVEMLKISKRGWRRKAATQLLKQLSTKYITIYTNWQLEI